MSETAPPQVAKASTIFSNIGTLLRAGMFPGQFAHEVANCIKFCDDVVKGETAKEAAEEKKMEGGSKAPASSEPAPSEGGILQ